jgi:hypothetical protein
VESPTVLETIGFQKELYDRTWKSETYTVVSDWFDRIVEFSDLVPTVDAFAGTGNNQLPKYWCKQTDAFKQDWSSEILWMNPPFSQMDRVIQKILEEEAQGILIIPYWPRFLWFTVLESIAVKWMDIEHTVPLYRDTHGRLLSQRPGWTSRAVVFNAFGALSDWKQENPKWFTVEPTVSGQDVTGHSLFSLRSLLRPTVEKPLSLSLDQILDSSLDLLEEKNLQCY